jgi:hypothetical protein
MITEIIFGAVLAVGLACWWLLRRERAAVAEARVQRAAIPDPYDRGEAAAKAGEPFWANPYCNPSGGRSAHDHWFAGWSFGKQQLEGMAPMRQAQHAGKETLQ